MQNNGMPTWKLLALACAMTCLSAVLASCAGTTDATSDNAEDAVAPAPARNNSQAVTEINDLMMSEDAASPSGQSASSASATSDAPKESSQSNTSGESEPSTPPNASGSSETRPPSKAAGEPEASSSSTPSTGNQQLSIAYPAGWLVAECAGIPAGKTVQVMYLPDVDVSPHRNGEPIASEEANALRDAWDFSYEDMAVVQYDGRALPVAADYLLVNLPDILPDASYDIAYSHSAPSSCAGREIDGVTGERLDGYVAGEQESEYWQAPRFVAPCAYATAAKAARAAETLAANGYKLLVYDAYRPMRAQQQLSDCFATAYAADPAIQESLGEWQMGWYVADGPSGHNFGTDLDVGICDEQGTPLEMPSGFDAFDEAGHLTDWPMAASEISEESYREAVRSNVACMALHRAFVDAGFSELASEWWHFGDDETQAMVAALAGEGGLDFVAEL